MMAHPGGGTYNSRLVVENGGFEEFFQRRVRNHFNSLFRRRTPQQLQIEH